MHITMMHNPKAGRGKHGKKKLLGELAKAGHEVRYRSTKNSAYKKAFKKETDLVLAAGGDGTIAKVAWRLIDTGIPLAVLPLGTANNLARSFGFADSPESIIERLDRGNKRTSDIGLAKGPWGERYFFESAGAGLLAAHVQAAKGLGKRMKKLSPEQEMARHVSLLREMLRDYQAQKWSINLNGKDFSGRYILWEAMNIRSVGPALYLAPQAQTKDGWFDLVLAGEQDRVALMEHLDARLAGRKTRFPLPIRKFRELKVVWKKSIVHFDDKLWPEREDKPKRSSEITIAVKPSALIILEPE